MTATPAHSPSRLNPETKKVGLLGGTFDPIHYGHIRPALDVMHQLGLDEVWLMPNRIPPHKQGTHTSTQHRLAMVQLVCDSAPQLQLCDIEVKPKDNPDTRTMPSYTVNTLIELRSLYPSHQFAFIMGMDSFVSLASWHRWQELLTLADIILCQRPGFSLPKDSQMAKYHSAHLAANSDLALATHGRIFSVDVVKQPYSSTSVRQRLVQNLPVDDAVPREVIQYIQRHKLYNANST